LLSRSGTLRPQKRSGGREFFFWISIFVIRTAVARSDHFFFGGSGFAGVLASAASGFDGFASAAGVAAAAPLGIGRPSFARGFAFDRQQKLVVLLQEFLDHIASLPDTVFFVGEPGAGFCDDVLLDGHIDQITEFEMPSLYRMSNSASRKGARPCSSRP